MSKGVGVKREHSIGVTGAAKRLEGMGCGVYFFEMSEGFGVNVHAPRTEKRDGGCASQVFSYFDHTPEKDAAAWLAAVGDGVAMMLGRVA